MPRNKAPKPFKKPIPNEYDRLPNIVPVQSASHSLLAIVKNEVNNLPHYSAYLVWLDCLYESNVTYDTILEGLEPLLDPIKRRTVKIRNIFIRGHKFDDGSYKPGGSCYLMIPDSLRGQSRNRDFELDILESGIHMSRVETKVLLKQLNQYPTLVLTEGFKDQLAQISIDELSKVCKINAAPTPSPALRGEQSNVVNQQQSQPQPQPQFKKPATKKQQQVTQPLQLPSVLPRVANKAPPSQPELSQPSNSKPASGRNSINHSVEDLARLLQQSSIANQQSSSNGLPKLPQQNGLNNSGPKSANSIVHKSKVFKANNGNGNANGILSQEMFEANLLRNVEESEKRSEFVSSVLPSLHKFGDTVIKIENLPAKLTVHALNLMMGTYSLTSEQIVATAIPGEKGELMNIRIIMRSNNADLQRIVSKNKWKTSYDTLLLIKRTDLKELEAFLNENHDKIHRLETSDKLPVNSIGYGKLLTN